MNIEITDWWIDEEKELLTINFNVDDIEMTTIFWKDHLYNALVEVGVFDSFSFGLFTNYIESPVDEYVGVTQLIKIRTDVDNFWRDFNHLVDTRIMKQLVELKIKKQTL